MFPKKNFWIVLITFVVVISAGYIYYNNVYKPATAEPETPPVQTAVARRGDLSIFTSGAGRVVPATEIALGFPESGVLIELLVKLGDEVKERQILARMKTKETPESLAVSLADAELNAIKVQQELDAIYETAEMDTALALQAVESAQQALEDLNNPELQQALALQAISEAEETVKDAERALYNTQSTASQADIDTAYVQVLLAENALSKAQERYGPYANKPEDNLRRAQLLSQLSAAQQAYDATVRTYNAMTSTGDEA
ncbi:MAG TPA: efflux RND transporter periplasmic adaptor subunit, partial [bacterium]|nr:efflux RND transporter periplasmic adaptor subunit [bacterium]